jgi:hypothetical protein
MRKIASIMVLFGFTLLALAGCGGDSGCGNLTSGTGSTTSQCGTGTTNPPQTPAAVTVSTTTATIPGDGSAGATITAVVTGSTGTAIANTTVTFSTSAGTLSASTGTTSSTGQVTTSLTASGVASGTAIAVTATAGSVSGKTTVTVAAAGGGKQTISVITNQPQIPSDGSQNATITALVRDASNNLVAGVPVTFTATSGGIAVTQATTDATGSALATLSTAGDPSNRTITVTAAAGAATSTVPVTVAGTKLTLTGSSSLVMGGQGTYNVGLVDSAGNGIAMKAIPITSTAGNTLSAATVTTDSTGHATFQMTASVAGNDTLTATVLGITSTEAVTVSAQSFAFTTPAANTPINLGASQNIAVTWTNAGAPQAGQVVSFSTTRGLFGGAVTTTATTDGSGVAQTTISSTTSGPAVITATATGVNAQLPVSFIATNPSQISVQTTPSTVAVGGQSTITAIVRDAQNNLVQNQVVTFQLADVTGGSLSVGSATTDSQGLAQTVYTASTTPSSTNGVTITASLQSNSAIAQSVSLTVGGQAVQLSLGTGNQILEVGTTVFQMPFTVTAVDAGGNPVNGLTVTLSVHSVQYGKGFWYPTSGTPAWLQGSGSLATPNTFIYTCANEDVDLTGIYSLTKDTNTNGVLDPGEIATVSPSTAQTAVITDTAGNKLAGAINLLVSYPEDHADWVEVQLVATATVAGTQSTATSTFWLKMLAAKLTDKTVAPPGETSPYGVNAPVGSPPVCSVKN